MKNSFLIFSRNLFAMAALVCITSCGVFVDPADEKITSKPEVLFQEGSYYLNKNNFKAAAEKFETLENEHPTSEYTPEAKVRKAYALFLDGNYILSQLIIDDFIRQYPAHNSTSYMYYLKGLSYYNQIVDIGRDQELTHKALESFEDVIRRYPYSKYAKDAKLKIDYAKNTLAGKEMDIGRFYVRTNKLIAALGRFENVVDNYETSIFIPEALYRLTEIYYALGDIEQAKVYASVLGHNYPDDDWYAKSYDIIVDKEFDPNVSWYKKYLGNIW